MNRILEVDRANLTVTVEPGVVTNAINEAVRELGLFYAGYPMSLESCFIGGNVAENAGGGRAIELPERLDLALWRDQKGEWRGVLHGSAGPVPAELLAITRDWQRSAAPRPDVP